MVALLWFFGGIALAFFWVGSLIWTMVRAEERGSEKVLSVWRKSLCTCGRGSDRYLHEIGCPVKKVEERMKEAA